MKTRTRKRQAARMPLLTPWEYRQMLHRNPRTTTPQAERLPAILQYARQVWPTLELPERELQPDDVSAVRQHGQRLLYHLPVDADHQPETFLIVAEEKSDEEIHGHILIDLAAETASPRLICPICEYDDLIEPGWLEHLLSQFLPEDDQPYAILERTPGTFMATYCTEEGYQLVHQLVNSACLYQAAELITLEAVCEAMSSYAFAGDDWLQMFDWQKQGALSDA